jgi:hypothetical protein
MASFVRYPWSDATDRERPRAHEVNEAMRAATEQREPVKFEAGQVVRTRPMRVAGSDVDIWIVAGGPADGYIGYPSYAMSEPSLRRTIVEENNPRLLSPAPCRGDTWSNGESVATIYEPYSINGGRLGIRTTGEPFVGNVVAVARKLWEGGYRRVDRVSISKQIEGPARVRSVYMDGKTFPLNCTDVDGAPSYLTLDDLKACVPTHEEQTRSFSAHQRMLDDADIEMMRVVCGSEAAEKLRAAQDRRREMIEAAVKTAIVNGMSVADVAIEIQRIVHDDETDAQLRARLKARFAQSRIDATTPQSAIDGYTWTPVVDDRTRHMMQRTVDSARVDRAIGDDLSDLAEVRGVPVLRAGMVVRAEDTASGERSFGVVVEADGPRVFVRWSGESIPVMCHRENPTEARAIGRWRIVTPDVRPLASLANAVAAVFARPDLTTSRRYIDQAIARLRGEPFAAAVAAALVAAGDAPLSPHQIAALVRGARAHEARRSEVAPARRTLTDGQLRECFTAGMRASGGEWYVRLSHVYERARTA